MLSEQLNLDREKEKEKNYVGLQVNSGNNKNMDNTLILDDLGQPSKEVINSKFFPQPRKENNQDNNKNNSLDYEDFDKMIEELHR